jgi:hypothetical protein
MSRLDVKTPRQPGQALGVGEASEAGNLGAHHSMQGPACTCRMNPSGCLLCRRWHRTILGINARRADALRLQALGDLATAGG